MTTGQTRRGFLMKVPALAAAGAATVGVLAPRVTDVGSDLATAASDPFAASAVEGASATINGTPTLVWPVEYTYSIVGGSPSGVGEAS